MSQIVLCICHDALMKDPKQKANLVQMMYQLSKTKVEEGKIIEGKVTKITEKYIFIFVQGLKSEPVIDVN